MNQLKYPAYYFWDTYCAYVNTDIPVIIVTDELLELMVRHDSDYFDVPARKTTVDHDLRFLFDVYIYEDIRFFDFKRIEKI